MWYVYTLLLISVPLLTCDKKRLTISPFSYNHPRAMKSRRKEMLLTELKIKTGEWVSGRYLGEKLAVSRCAVWKHAAALKEDGYIIEASTRKGYRLQGLPDLLTPGEIVDGLATTSFGRPEIHHCQEVDSTNVLAKELALRGAPEGAVVVAEGQRAGRGRRGRHWYSPPHEGIYVSLILRPALTPAESSRITLAAAVASAQALRKRTGLPVMLKWPNDLLVAGKKLGGILTEIAADTDGVEYAVVGFGLNVNTPPQGFPPELRDMATSILAVTGRRTGRAALLRSYLEHFEEIYLSLSRGGLPILINAWRSLSALSGRRVRVTTADGETSGVVADIDDDGALILREDQGGLRRLYAGDLWMEEGEEP